MITFLVPLFEFLDSRHPEGLISLFLGAFKAPVGTSNRQNPLGPIDDHG